MPTSETATKVEVQPSVGGGQDVESLMSYTVVSGETTAASVAPGQSLLKKVTVEPASLDPNNLNATDFSGQLSDLAALDSIQAELDRIQNSDGDNLNPPVSASSSSSSSSSSQVTMSSNDGASFLGSISDNSGVITTHGGSAGTPQVVSVLQGAQLQEALSQQVQNVQTKRTLNSNSVKGQVVTKVIIAKNPGQTQQVTIPISSHSAPPQQHQFMMVGTQGLSSVSTPMGLQSPTKTITLTPSGIQQSPTKFITMTQGSPSKIITGQKIAVSPGKTPTKITMIPVAGKSPQRIITSSGQIFSMVQKSIGSVAQGITTLTSASTKPSTITMSPSKVILKQQAVTNQAGQKMTLVQQVNPPSKIQGIPLSSVANIQPVSVAGSKFQYVRLVTTPASQTQTTLATAKHTTIAPITLQAKPIVSSANTQMKITLPTASSSNPQVITRPAVQQTPQSQRIILPATNQVSIRPSSNTLAQIRPAGSTGATLTQLPPGTTIISSGQNLQGFALVPAQYVTQVGTIGQQLSTPQIGTTVQRQESSSSNFVPIATSSTQEQTPRQNVNGSLLQEPSGQRPRKPCNCTKSQCLKLYCDCFANGEFCHNCNCTNCANNLEHEDERSRAIKVCLDRNPLAFHPKIGKGRGERRHTKGCNCKRSGCLKNYCECYEAKILCTSICKCVGCKNFEESPDRKTLMHLADAAEVRVQQQTSAKAKLSSQIQDLPTRPPAPVSGERYAYTFVTNEVAEATCACLIAQAEEAERTRQLELNQERMILEEFGRCLMQVIESASRTKVDQSL